MAENDFKMMKTRMKSSTRLSREQPLKIASAVNHAQHYDFPLLELVKDRVPGKSANGDATNAAQFTGFEAAGRTCARPADYLCEG